MKDGVYGTPVEDISALRARIIAAVLIVVRGILNLHWWNWTNGLM
jgi:hypothetical protein